MVSFLVVHYVPITIDNMDSDWILEIDGGLFAACWFVVGWERGWRDGGGKRVGVGGGTHF